ncbi:signal transduction histidine kinase [Marmoricola sp. OAE513]|uniref:sensor histidine kinase n=1 Tax=Marmoricola sp. OAE513 TaxID=2817894 RepID=UPI001AEA7727
MRRNLILTVAAVVTMVLLAMLVPMAVLVRSYALEDRLSRAALEVQATETVVSGQDKGTVAQYLDRINGDHGITTTVFYPDGIAVGPAPDADPRIADARRTGQARVDDVDDGTQMLIPVSQGGSSALPSQTPVIRVLVKSPGIGSSVGRAWLALAGLGLVLLAGSLVLADRLGRSFVQPIRDLASRTQSLGAPGAPVFVEPSGPPEVRELGSGLNRLVSRVELLLERERESVSDLSHRLRTPVTALRLRIDGLSDPDERARVAADLDDLEATVDRIIREARRSEREGVDPRTDARAALVARVRFWEPLAEDQGRSLTVRQDAGDPVEVRIGVEDLNAMVDVILDNVFSHTDEGAAIAVTVSQRTDGVTLTVEDGGPGFPDGVDVTDRGTSGAGSTGLGLSIVDRIAAESGGALRLSRSASLGGARLDVELGRS